MKIYKPLSRSSNIYLKAINIHQVNHSDLDTSSWYHRMAASVECVRAPMGSLLSPDSSWLALLFLDYKNHTQLAHWYYIVCVPKSTRAPVLNWCNGFSHLINYLINQSINKSICLSINRSINQSVDSSISQSNKAFPFKAVTKLQEAEDVRSRSPTASPVISKKRSRIRSKSALGENTKTLISDLQNEEGMKRWDTLGKN